MLAVEYRIDATLKSGYHMGTSGSELNLPNF